MNCRQPFIIFPWDSPFLPALEDYLYQLTAGDIGNSLIIVPHNRPRRYLTELFRHDTRLSRPVFLPRILTVTEMITLFRAQTVDVPLYQTQELDRVALLYQSVQAVMQQTPHDMLCQHFGDMDMARFLPWGLRLSAVFEECFTQCRTTQDILYTDGEVAPLATALLGALARIQDNYLNALHERAWTTPGLDAYVAATQPCSLPVLLDTQHIIIAGISARTTAEDILLKRLWEAGAHVCLHTDPLLADTTQKAHWSVADHEQWLRQWNAHTTLAQTPSGNAPKLTFTAAYDVHSQLAVMRDALQRTMPDAQTTAIVLANNDILLPVLHHLPDQDFNVSMGYPLARAPLCHLIFSILQLHMDITDKPSPASDAPEQNATVAPMTASAATNTCVNASDSQEGGGGCRYHWQGLIRCWQHPYLRMLHVSDATPPCSLRGFFAQLETQLRAGGRFADPWEMLAEAVAKLQPAPAQTALMETLFTCIFTTFSTADSPKKLADAIEVLCHILLSHGEDVWERFPLDAEALYRLRQRILPQLRSSALAEEIFPPGTLFHLLEQLIALERVPFEAEPLTALQVLGMLETRLLHFDRLYILDATDDNLPGFSSQDPLLPDSLRPLLGLPDTHHRERTVAHHFFRLINGAKEVHILWQEGVHRTESYSVKNSRSRFVEELIWHIEKQQKSLLTAGTPPLLQAPYIVRPLQRTPHAPPFSPALQEKLHALLQGKISPTVLDTYLVCPAQFSWRYLYKIQEVNSVNEGDDSAQLGQLIHDVLHTLYAPWEGKTVTSQELPPSLVQHVFMEKLENSSLRTTLPPDSYYMLAAAGAMRLNKFIENQPATTHIFCLEKALQAPVANGRYTLYGKLDRVDKRADQLWILDYKTGFTPKVQLWDDTSLCNSLLQWDTSYAPDMLAALADALPKAQLLCYLHMCFDAYKDTSIATYNAAWVDLYDTCKEIPLCPENIQTQDNPTLQQYTSGILSFLTQHLALDTYFAPRTGMHCDWCPYVSLCQK